MKNGRWVLAVVAVLCWGPGAAEAQIIMGRVLLQGQGVGIEGVDITLVTEQGIQLLMVRSDRDGLFTIPIAEPGRYQLVAERLGLAQTRSGFFDVEREILDVELRMAEEPILVDPITVVGRRRIRSGSLDEFYNRLEENKALGNGYFITLEEIEQQAAVRTSSLLRSVPSLEIVPSGSSGNEIYLRVGGSRCVPNFYLDGLPVMLEETTQLDNIMITQDLEGIEIYNRGHMDRAFGYDVEPCGAILFWRKEDWGHPYSLGRVLMAIGVGGLLFILGSGF